MSKRFTESDKWRDVWFRKLSPLHKCLWTYLTDNCDQAGVIDIDWELASFQIGAKVKADDLTSAFGKQVYALPCGKWIVLRFVEFQYGTPSRSCKPHARIFDALERHGISLEWISERVSEASSKGIEGYNKASLRLEEEEGKKRGIGSGGEDDAGAPDTPPTPSQPTSADVYEAYPRKEARKDAVKSIDRAAREAPGGMAYLLDRTKVYAACVARWTPDERRFIPHPATWFNQARYDDNPALWSRSEAVIGTPVKAFISPEPPNWRAIIDREFPTSTYAGITTPWSKLSVSDRDCITQAIQPYIPAA